ncbi:MAG: ABC transporter permease [Lachnospiraceae bacterium]|nr:ABC transporter permease [Lachnospiraceae bacterium]
MKSVFRLAWQSIKYYKEQALSIFFSIIIAVALTICISTLVYSGEQSNLENQRALYGDYHYHLYVKPEIIEKIENKLVSEQYTIEKLGKYTVKGAIEDPAEVLFIYGDKEYIDMSGRTVLQGAYPKKTEEIALDQFTMRNLNIEGDIGDKVILGGKQYILSAIMSDATATYSDNMICFVSDKFAGEVDKTYLYVKFDEKKNLFKEVSAFMQDYNLSEKELQGNTELIECLFAGNFSQLINRLVWIMKEPESNFTSILLTLRYEFKLTSNIITIILCIFSVFIIYSIFNISVLKRMSQFGIMETLGIGNNKIFQTLLTELLLLFIGGFPIGCLLGGGVAKYIYAKAGQLFVGDGAIFKQTHVGDAQSHIAINSTGENLMQHFSIDKGSMKVAFCFLSILLLFVSVMIIRRIKKATIIQMLEKQTKKTAVEVGKIYSLKHSRLYGILTRKFTLSRKGVFFGIIFSLSLGGILFLGTSFVIQNTKLNNLLTLKSDDGLHSDCQIYISNSGFKEGIPQDIYNRMKYVDGIKEIHPTKYFFGEIPITKEKLEWKEFFPEIANDPTWKQTADIMSRFNGICVETDSQYKIKTDIYGYDDEMLNDLEDYKIEGTINPESMNNDNTVILKTLIDSQNNSDGLHIKVGDTIKIKVPANLNVPAEVLRFDQNEDQYVEKEFVVSAVVNRVMAQNDRFIGNEGLDVIMTNEQMRNNFEIDQYNMVNIVNSADADSTKMLNSLHALVNGIPDCIVKDYSAEVRMQELYLQQKLVLFYGIAAIILIISILHIINSMSYLILERKREFGIMRAMGITDKQFYKMMVREGIIYGCVGSGVMLGIYAIVNHILTYMMKHVYLYVSTIQQLNIILVLLIVFLNIIIAVMAVILPSRQIVKGSIIKEINA